VIPFPTVTLDPMRDLQRVSWQYRNRETGAPIPTPSFIGIIGVLISSVNSSGTLDFCFSGFFDRTVTSFTSPTADCPNLIHWDDVFILSFIYVDSLTFNAYGVSFDGPRLSFPQLAVGVVGPGTVTSSPAGISCGTQCLGSFARGSTVTLTAAPASGATFLGWKGACSGTSRTCLVTMSTDRAVGAAFAPAPQVRFLNFTCVAPSCAPYTATLTSSLGEGHTWSSVSGGGIALPGRVLDVPQWIHRPPGRAVQPHPGILRQPIRADARTQVHDCSGLRRADAAVLPLAGQHHDCRCRDGQGGRTLKSSRRPG
jgi:hypothetical protein